MYVCEAFSDKSFWALDNPSGSQIRGPTGVDLGFEIGGPTKGAWNGVPVKISFYDDIHFFIWDH